MANTYQQDPATLPPLTKTIVDAFGPKSKYGLASPSRQMEALIDAIYDLETRVTALENP